MSAGVKKRGCPTEGGRMGLPRSEGASLQREEGGHQGREGGASIDDLRKVANASSGTSNFSVGHPSKGYELETSSGKKCAFKEE